MRGCQGAEGARIELENLQLDGFGRSALYFEGYSNVTVTNCGFSANGGSAINFSDLKNNLRVRRSEFYDNNTPLFGGAIRFNYDENVADVAESLFARNSAEQGGAISANYGSTLQVRNCSFYDNWARCNTLCKYLEDHGGGGAIALYAGRLVVFASDFRNNTADSGGGEHSHLW